MNLKIELELAFHGDRWFAWSEIKTCFWPSRGCHPPTNELSDVGKLGGMYLLSWSQSSPTDLMPTEPTVKYIGETVNFRNRLKQFGRSAGFFGDASAGHSAGWRWPLEGVAHLYVGFLPIQIKDKPEYFLRGLRRYAEGAALQRYEEANGRLPQVTEFEHTRRKNRKREEFII